MADTQESRDAEYQAFLSWKKNGSPTGELAAERPLPTIGEVLKTLVNGARLSSEQIVQDFHKVIDAHFPAEVVEAPAEVPAA